MTSLADVLSKDPSTWERWGEKCLIGDINSEFLTALPRNPEHSNNRVRFALPKTHPEAKAISAALQTCRDNFVSNGSLNGGCAAEALFIPIVVSEDGGVGITFNISARKMERQELGAVHVQLPNDECVPGKSMDLDDGQGKIIGVEELLDMDKPPNSVYRLKLMVMKWCFSDGGEKKAGFSLSLAGRRDAEPFALMLFNADKGPAAYLGGGDMSTARASVEEVHNTWNKQTKRSGYDMQRLASIGMAVQMSATPEDGILTSPNFGIVCDLCRPDGELAASLGNFLITPAKFGELDTQPTRGSYNERNSCLTAWLHGCRGGNTQWYMHDVEGIFLRTTREEQRFPWTLKVLLPDGDANSRSLKQNIMRLYNKALDGLSGSIVSLMGPELPAAQNDAVLEFERKQGSVRDKQLLQSIDDPDMPELAPKNEDEISEFLPITMRNDQKQISMAVEDDTALFWRSNSDSEAQSIESVDNISDGAGHKFIRLRRAVVQMRLNVKTVFRSKKNRSLLALREPRLVMKAVALEFEPSMSTAPSSFNDSGEPSAKRLCF